MLQTLLRIADQYGTPTFAYNLDAISRQISRLRRSLPSGVDVLYSLKANPSLGLCNAIARHGLGADVSSVGEAAVALKAGFSPDKMCVSGPYKSPELLAAINQHPEITLSIDSVSELCTMVRAQLQHPVIIRLRPDFQPTAAMTAGLDDRFGIPLEDLGQCLTYISDIKMIGFHVYCGSQIMGTKIVADHFERAYGICMRGADILKHHPTVLNLGGGLGIPYRQSEQRVDIDVIADKLSEISDRLPETCIKIELGRFIVAEAGWFLTTVVGRQTRSHFAAVVVDGGTHQRADLCGIGLKFGSIPPSVLNMTGLPGDLQPTDVLGCLCLSDDVLAERAPLPPLSVGDVLAFPNAGAYGLTASPGMFLSHPIPAEAAFWGGHIAMLRERSSPDEALRNQHAPLAFGPPSD